MPRRAFCACTKCAPWLGVPTAFWMSAMGTPWVRSGKAVTAQWGLLERHEDAVCMQRGRTWSPQERRCRRWRLHGDLAECMETSLHLYRILMERLRHLHCAYTEYHLFHCALTETTHSCRGDHRDPMVLARSPSVFAGHMQGVCMAHAQRSQCVVNYDLQKRMAHKPLLWTCSTSSKFPTLTKIHVWIDV